MSQDGGVSRSKSESKHDGETELSQSAIEALAGKTIEVDKLSDFTASIDSSRPRPGNSVEEDTFNRSKSTTMPEDLLKKGLDDT